MEDGEEDKRDEGQEAGLSACPSGDVECPRSCDVLALHQSLQLLELLHRLVLDVGV